MGIYNLDCIDESDFFLSIADIDECASSPCKNGGTCIDLNAEWTSSSSGFTVGYACQCMAGYTGEQCNTSRNSRFGSLGPPLQTSLARRVRGLRLSFW